jgi:uncharacterized protein with HEPN domain
MTQHDDTVRLRHMLDHALEAIAMAQGRQQGDLDTDRMLQLALVRLVEIVGEAATRVSAEGQQRWPGIPWQAASGMRNRLIHGYDKVDLNVLWDTVRDDLPALVVQLRDVLGERR